MSGKAKLRESALYHISAILSYCGGVRNSTILPTLLHGGYNYRPSHTFYFGFGYETSYSEVYKYFNFYQPSLLVWWYCLATLSIVITSCALMPKLKTLNKTLCFYNPKSHPILFSLLGFLLCLIIRGFHFPICTGFIPFFPTLLVTPGLHPHQVSPLFWLH